MVRIKTLLSKALDHECSQEEPNEEDTKQIISYLITLGEEKTHLKQFFLKLKTQNIKRKLSNIVKEKKQPEILVEVYNSLANEEHPELTPEKYHQYNEEELR